MLSKEEIKKWLLENCINEDGNLDLMNLDFSDFNGNVMINCMTVKKDLFQGCQQVQGNLYQSFQIVGRNLYQKFQKVEGRLYQREIMEK